MTLEEMKRIKKEKGYSLAQISKYSGIPLGTVQKIFSGQTESPRYATRRALERVLLRDEEADVCSYPSKAELDAARTEQVREAISYAVPKGKKQGEYTVEDYYNLPDDQRVELIDGVFYEMEAPGFVHQRIVLEISFRFSDYIRKKGGACIVLSSPFDVRLDCDNRTMVQPDVVVICDRDKVRRWGMMGAPDFALEVISDSTRKKDYTLKVQKYANAGVREYWIIDPKRRALITYVFSDDYMPHFYPLSGTVGVAIYDGDLQIDLDEVAALIEDWPD